MWPLSCRGSLIATAYTTWVAQQPFYEPAALSSGNPFTLCETIAAPRSHKLAHRPDASALQGSFTLRGPTLRGILRHRWVPPASHLMDSIAHRPALLDIWWLGQKNLPFHLGTLVVPSWHECSVLTAPHTCLGFSPQLARVQCSDCTAHRSLVAFLCRCSLAYCSALQGNCFAELLLELVSPALQE